MDKCMKLHDATPQSVRNLPPGRMVDIKKHFESVAEKDPDRDSPNILTSPKVRQRVKNPFMIMDANDGYATVNKTAPVPRVPVPLKIDSPFKQAKMELKKENFTPPCPIPPVRKKKLSGSLSDSGGSRPNSEGDNPNTACSVLNKRKCSLGSVDRPERKPSDEVFMSHDTALSVSSRLNMFQSPDNDVKPTISPKIHRQSLNSPMTKSEHETLVSSISRLMVTTSTNDDTMTKSDSSHNRPQSSPQNSVRSHVVVPRKNALSQGTDNVQHVLFKRTEAPAKPNLQTKPTTPIPPKKPPRTHAHDQYMETKQIIHNMILPPDYSTAKPVVDFRGPTETKENTPLTKPLKPPIWNITPNKIENPKVEVSKQISLIESTDIDNQKKDPVVKKPDSISHQFGVPKQVTPVKPAPPKKVPFSSNRSSISRSTPVSSRPEKPKRPPPPRPRPASLVSGASIDNSPRETPPLRHSFRNNPLYEPMLDAIESKTQTDDQNKGSSKFDVHKRELSAEFKNAQRKFSDAIARNSSKEYKNERNNTNTQPTEKLSAVSQMEQRKLPPLEAPMDTINLPRQVQIMLWRSCSDEYLYTGDSTANSPVYMDPMDNCLDRVTSLDDTFASPDVEVYMDTDGYAIPYRFKKSRLSPRRSDGPAVISEKGKAKSRMRGLFRLLSETKEDGTECDTPKSRKRKLNQVRHKINSAFSILRGKVKSKRSSTGSCEGVTDATLDHNISGEEEDSLVDQHEIRQRLEYVSSVRDKTRAKIRSQRLFEDKIYPQLFECAIIVGLQRTKSGMLGLQPEILHKFPELRNNVTTIEKRLKLCSALVNINETIPQFCFPDSEFINPRTASKKSESYSFVLTNEEGGRVFGYCRRYVVYKLGWKSAEVICIITPLNSFNLYKMLLDEIEARRQISMDQAQELIASSFGRPLPSPGRTVQIRTMNEDGDMETIVLARNMDTRLDNVDYELLFSVLGVDKLIRTFSAMLLERRLLFTSTKLSLLSSTIHALTSLLYPFSWQHTYIPVLPPKLLEITCTPTPYLIGILHSELDKVTELPTEEILIVDLDTKSLLESMGDENTILPKKLYKALKSALNMCRVDAEAERSKNLMISEAFIRLFVEILGHYGEFMSTQQDGETTFLKNEFVSSTKSESVRQFLSWFADTQMFEVFISDQVRAPKNADINLFSTRVSEYREEMDQLNAKSGKKLGQKFLNFGKAIRTKLA